MPSDANRRQERDRMVVSNGRKEVEEIVADNFRIADK